MSSIGTFSVVVVIFVCLINDVVVPFGFCIISSTGFIKVSEIDFRSNVCPGIIIIVFSSFLFNTETFDCLMSSLLLLFIIILLLLSLLWLSKSFFSINLFSWFWLSCKGSLGRFCWESKFKFLFILLSSIICWLFCIGLLWLLLILFLFEDWESWLEFKFSFFCLSLFIGLFFLLLCWFWDDESLSACRFWLFPKEFIFEFFRWISCSSGIWDIWINFSIYNWLFSIGLEYCIFWFPSISLELSLFFMIFGLLYWWFWAWEFLLSFNWFKFWFFFSPDKLMTV